ncbi:hypothetical protein [Nostoc sp.]|uniref:hypothetical protein n=1 Tax=Nostoc sp. TaxID=1180 RepID=UPI002FF7BAFC
MDKGCFPRSLPKTRTRSLIQLMPNRDRLLTDFPKYDHPLDKKSDASPQQESDRSLKWINIHFEVLFSLIPYLLPHTPFPMPNSRLNSTAP